MKKLKKAMLVVLVLGMFFNCLIPVKAAIGTPQIVSAERVNGNILFSWTSVEGAVFSLYVSKKDESGKYRLFYDGDNFELVQGTSQELYFAPGQYRANMRARVSGVWSAFSNLFYFEVPEIKTEDTFLEKEEEPPYCENVDCKHNITEIIEESVIFQPYSDVKHYEIKEQKIKCKSCHLELGNNTRKTKKYHTRDAEGICTLCGNGRTYPYFGVNRTALFSEYYTKELKDHLALDLASPEDGKVRAVAKGTVCANSYNKGGYGYHVILRHEIEGVEYFSLYAHMAKKSSVKIGDVITAGESIGKVGNTGSLSTGKHIHLAIYQAASPILPKGYARCTFSDYAIFYDYDDGQVKFRAYDPEEYFRTYGQVVSDNAGSYHY